MDADEIRSHPYYQSLAADLPAVPHVGPTLHPFWTRVLSDYVRLAAEFAGRDADIAILGAQLTEATTALHEARLPAPDRGGEARPLSHAAEAALTFARARARSTLDPAVIYPHEVPVDVAEELERGGLVTIDAPLRAARAATSDSWWSLPTASAALTSLALTLTPSEPT